MPDIDEVLSLVKQDYSHAAKMLQRRTGAAKRSIRELSYLAAAAAFALAKILEHDDEAWNRFVDEDALPRQAKLDREHCLRYAVMFMSRSADGTEAARACDDARKLAALRTSDALPRDVYQMLQDRGFSGLKRAETTSSPAGLKGRKP